MSFYLCIDCGGSKTVAVIADTNGNIVARVRGGPSNFAYLGLQPFIAVVRTTVEDALASLKATHTDLPESSLKLPPPTPLFAAAWLGVSGVDSPSAIATLTPPLTSLLGVRPRVANDTSLLAAPLKLYSDVSSAVGCVGGTGGIVVSFRETDAGENNGDGVNLDELGRVGGWGWILGDEGGGFHVGREAIRQLLAEADRASVQAPLGAPAPPTPVAAQGTEPRGLKARILARFGVKDIFEVLTIVHLPDPLPVPEPPTPPLSSTTLASVVPEEAHAAHEANTSNNPPATSFPREKRLSALAPLVFAAAFEDQDPLALRVLRIASGALADQICVLLRPEDANAVAQPVHGGEAGWMSTGWMGTGAAVAADPGPAPGPRTVRASESILCLGGSLVGLANYRQLLLDELKRRGYVFRRVQVVEDAAAVGAQALAQGARGFRRD
ncbi:hypothetical protein BKA93DRAFT_811979 [Sparassis latifolia]|uniref:N-acetyl-D-glucosamine kinase n=1 Tax=Sparassis crispa TaxID=139825 RepID=A0A401GFY8_9APHY|nr:hypothetical protein SCP_0307640 [Sparassis crispa]GBE81041.1 hypothetical protein SCP_0307640 [Sparassis crispa]